MEPKSEEEFFADITEALWDERLDDIEEYAKTEGKEARIEANEKAYGEMCNAYGELDRLINTYGDLENPDIAALYPEAAAEYKAAKDKYHEAEDAQLNDALDEVENNAIKEAQEREKERLQALQEEHCVRGAMMRCKYGSHYRRLNLPLTHGEIENGRPLVNSNDAVAGDDNNIPYFGVCTCPNYTTTEKEVLLKKDYPRDLRGKKLSDESEGNVKGLPCKPMILGEWKNSHAGTKLDGAAILTGSAFLVCQYGGLIEIVDSGQNDPETLQGIGEKN